MEEDADEIRQFMGIGNDGVVVTYPKSGNPFQFNPDASSAADSLHGSGEYAPDSDRFRKISLIQRIDTDKPKLPPCVTRATQLTQSTRASARDTQPQAASALARAPRLLQNNPRKQLISEFVLEKREKFLVQLIIDQKEKEMQRLRNLQESTEQKAKEMEEEIEKETDRNKMRTVQIEAGLARSRRMAEAASQARAAKAMELKQARLRLGAVRTQINENENLLETYRPYYDFMHMMLPEGETVDYFLKSPNRLTDELHRMEDENLFVIQQCQRLQDVLDRGSDATDAEIQMARETAKEMEEKLGRIEPEENVNYELSPDQKRVLYDEDGELVALQRMVKETYLKCFKSDADLDSISLLERLESQLQLMTELCSYVDPEFVAAKQAVKDKDRWEAQRKKMNDEREKEQKRKIDKALSRALKPIPKKVGRPVKERVLPIKRQKQSDEDLELARLEKEREERLLYGSLDDF